MLDFLNEANWWCLLLLLFLAYLLGWFLSKRALKSKYEADLDKCMKEKEKLRNASMNYKKATTTFKSDTKTPVIPVNLESSSNEENNTDSSEDKPKLNFASFGQADESQKDDLKKISGVGPFIEKKLNSIGIYTFDQISKFTKDDIDTVTQLIQFFPGRIERDNWKDQATKFKNE